ncbi:adenosylcobinamide amidohydrolase [bacterium]|nr:adenosylcobinamide amidohydrolase [bacterium]
MRSLQEAGIRSPVSNKLATSTGTDSAAVVSGPGPEKKISLVFLELKNAICRIPTC